MQVFIWIVIQISQKFVLKVPIDDKLLALVQVRAIN